MTTTIAFNKPYMTGKELEYIQKAYALHKLSGDGTFTKKCQQWLEQHIGCKKALLTQSCTAALEMAAILLDIQAGDEIIMPSYTFVSTANAFVLRGGVPVFVDIRADTLNIDENAIAAAITPKTKAIMVVHYGGVGCEMATILALAKQHGLYVIEDAAQGMMAYYQNRPLGSFGQLAAISFHDTKNIISGEGGALLINDERLIQRAEIIREKGTDRSRFLRGEVDKYTWLDIGSSFLPSEIMAAFLWAQLEAAELITQQRLAIWNTYHSAFTSLQQPLTLRLPIIPPTCQHNAHMYYILLANLNARSTFIQQLKQQGIQAVSHYVPLHTSLAAEKYTRTHGLLTNSTALADRIVRLPLWVGLENELEHITQSIIKIISE